MLRAIERDVAANEVVNPCTLVEPSAAGDASMTEAARVEAGAHLTSLPASTRFVDVCGIRTRVIEAGVGPPLLLLHGVGGWAEHWRQILRTVSKAGYRGIACDLPGFGLSAPPPAVRYLDPPDPFYPRFVGGLLDALGLRRAVLVGHSLGGAIAAISALSFPERVERLVLAAPGGFGLVIPRRLRLCGLAAAGHVARHAPDSLFLAIVRASFRRPGRVPDWLYEDALRYCRSSSAVEATRVLSQLLDWRGLKPGLAKEWTKRMTGIQCPTIILWGRQDNTVPLPDAETLHQIPNSRIRVIEDAGHMLMLEQPDLFEGFILEFLNESRRPPRHSTSRDSTTRERQGAHAARRWLPRKSTGQEGEGLALLEGGGRIAAH